MPTKRMNGTAPPAPAHHHEPFRVLRRNGVTKVLDARDRPVEGVIACDIALRPGIPPLMRMNLAAAAFEVEGTPVFQMYDPVALKFRPIKRVEFTDGGADFVPEVAQPQAVVSAPVPTATEPAPEAVPGASHGD